MHTDYTKRAPTLPIGCHDILDAIKASEAAANMHHHELRAKARTPRQLAQAFSRKPYRVLHDLMEMGIHAGIDDQLETSVLSRVLVLYESGHRIG
jgi:hypothetical protein